MKYYLPSVLLGMSLLSAHTHADDIIEEFKITATHIPDTSATGHVPKVVITADHIEAFAPNSFADILRGIPGIDIMQQGGVGGLTFLSLRGGDPNFVVVIIDGVKVNDPTNSRGGAFDLGSIDPAVIEKVEIFFGSNSIVFGSDALAGVISIQTKGIEKNKLGFASAKIGSNTTIGGTLHSAFSIGQTATMSMTASYQDGDNSSFGDQFNRKEIIGLLKSAGNNRISWDIGVFIADGKAATFPEDSGGDRLATIRTPETRDFLQTNASGRLFWKTTDNWRMHLTTAWSRRSELISSPGIAEGFLSAVPAIDSDSEYERTDFNLTNIVNISKTANLAFGFEHTRESGNTDSFIDFGFIVPANYTLKRNTQSLFAEVGSKLTEGLHFTAGLRFDKAGTVEATTGRVIARYQITEDSTLSAQFSEGFKFPSFFALGHPFVGNPNLLAERSKNYDISFENSFFGGKLNTKASAYKNTFTNLVDFDPVLFTNVNRSMVDTKGIELFASVKAHETLSFSGSLTYNNINTFNPDTVLRRRPKWKGSLLITYQPLNTLSLNGRITFNDSYFDSSIPTGMIKLKGFSRLDMSAAWEITKNLKLRVSANNILDEQYEEAVGFYNTGRNLTLSLSKSF